MKKRPPPPPTAAELWRKHVDKEHRDAVLAGMREERAKVRHFYYSDSAWGLALAVLQEAAKRPRARRATRAEIPKGDGR